MDTVRSPEGKGFKIEPHYDCRSGTFTYLVFDTHCRKVAIVDPVLDFDYASGSVITGALDEIIRKLAEGQWEVEWILETHVHADHISGAQYIKQKLGGRVATGKNIVAVQSYFLGFYGQPGCDERPDGGYDYLFDDKQEFFVGDTRVTVWLVPGHTPADTAYIVHDNVFVGDTIFMPDSGTARVDFPGGCGKTLFASIRRILSLPQETRLYMCHDYPREGREICWVSTVAEQREKNVHVKDGTTEEAFVALRQQRDSTLAVPALMLAAIQVNMNAGILPQHRTTERRFLTIPLRFVSDGDSSVTNLFAKST